MREPVTEAGRLWEALAGNIEAGGDVRAIVAIWRPFIEAALLAELRAALDGLPVGRVASWFERGVVAERATDVLDRAAVLALLEPPR